MNTALSRTNKTLRKIRRQWLLILLSIPLIIYYFTFVYSPLYQWLWAFFDYKPSYNSIFQGSFIGFMYFEELFGADGFWLALRNTLMLAVLNLSMGMLSSIAFAVLLNELKFKRFKKVTQTVAYLPHFMSWVIVVNIFTNLLKLNNGTFNDFLVSIGILKKPYPFLLQGNIYWVLITIMGIWKETGWSTIIYLSAMTGIDEQLYEAAYVDGAGRLRRIWHITLPGIRETVILLMIMNVGGILGTGYEQALLMSNGANIEYADVIATYTIRYGLNMGRISYATAATIFQSGIGFMLVLLTNFLSKKLAETNLF